MNKNVCIRHKNILLYLYVYTIYLHIKLYVYKILMSQKTLKYLLTKFIQNHQKVITLQIKQIIIILMTFGEFRYSRS